MAGKNALNELAVSCCRRDPASFLVTLVQTGNCMSLSFRVALLELHGQFCESAVYRSLVLQRPDESRRSHILGSWSLARCHLDESQFHEQGPTQCKLDWHDEMRWPHTHTHFFLAHCPKSFHFHVDGAGCQKRIPGHGAVLCCRSLRLAVDGVHLKTCDSGLVRASP